VLLELQADEDGGVRGAVADRGTWRPVPADPGSRGRGLQIITALVTDLDVERSSAGTTLRFRLPPSAVRPPSAGGTGSTAAAVPHGPARLEVRDEKDRRCVELVGDLDLVGVEAVHAALFDELTGGRAVVLDLTRLGVLTSVGAGLLLEAVEAAEAAGVGLEVLLPGAGPVRRLLDLTGLSGTLVGGTPQGR
jgi:anti-anti-sigma factor